MAAQSQANLPPNARELVDALKIVRISNDEHSVSASRMELQPHALNVLWNAERREFAISAQRGDDAIGFWMPPEQFRSFLAGLQQLANEAS